MSNSDKPTVAQYKPYYMDVEAGKSYLWCSCGLSKTQPWCDKSHVGTNFKPLRYKAEESKSVLFCGCKHTANGPFCDGAHNNLTDEYAEDERPLDALLETSELVVADDNGIAKLDGDCYVMKKSQMTFLQNHNLREANVIDEGLGAEFIAQQYVEVGSGESPTQQYDSADVLIYALNGSGFVNVENEVFAIEKEVGVFIAKNEVFSLSSDDELNVLVTICPGNISRKEGVAMTSAAKVDREQRLGLRDPALRSTMADRFYQVLIGEHSGSFDVAQFIGEVPESKAAPHRHLYEEAITVLSGTGMMWTETKRTPVDVGDIIFLPAQQEHSLQCTDKNGLALVGHFYPSGEPNINY